MKNLTLRILLPLIPLVIIAVVAEMLSRYGVVAPYILPPPSDIFATFSTDAAEYYSATKDTISAALLGLVLAGISGVIIAILFSSSRLIERSLYPYATFFQTVPIVSIAPLLVIWFGFGFRTVVISSFIVSIFPVIANTFAGLRATDPALLDLFRLYGSSRLNVLLKLRLPQAVPQILTGLKISTGLAMIGAVIGEFIAGGGLGGVIDASRTQQRLDKVFAAVLLASFSGLLLLFLLNLLSNSILKTWKGHHD
ncbi:MAG: transport system permease protein [Pseudobdellovibrio sp.]|nr:transport system permease protein [Pseudobdellovibrio sp.]